MYRIALVSAAAAVLALTACSSTESGPTREQRACETIKVLTPGVVEQAWNTEVLADRNATARQKSDALKSSLDLLSSTAGAAPYACSGPVFERYLAEYDG